MFVRVIAAACAVLFVGSALASDLLSDARLAVFAPSEVGDKLVIKCKPRAAEIAPQDWVDACNRLGKAALIEAERNGDISTVTGKAFGAASEVAKSAPPVKGVSPTELEREFPLIERSKAT
jgi:hypothetical protein